MVPKSKAALRASRTSTDMSAQSEARSFVTFTLFLCWKLTETLQINHVCNRCSNKSSVSCLQLVIKNVWWTQSYRKLSSVSLPMLDLITAAGMQRTPNAVWENTPGEQHLFVFWAMLTRMLFRASYAQFLHSAGVHISAGGFVTAWTHSHRLCDAMQPSGRLERLTWTATTAVASQVVCNHHLTLQTAEHQCVCMPLPLHAEWCKQQPPWGETLVNGAHILA